MSTVINGANFKRVHVTTASVTMDPDTEYTMSYAGDNEFLLPAVAPIGSVITIVNDTDGSLDITQNAGQAIHNLGTSTTRGVTGGMQYYIRTDHLYLRNIGVL